MKAYVFPGQGSQKKGMGENLFDLFPNETKKADAILGYSIKDLCLNDSQNVLSLTQYTQPAIYVVSALEYLKKIKESEKPDYVAGHSLGEYAALFAAGVFDFETGLKLVHERGKIMAEIKGGAMAAVIGIKDQDLREILNKNNLATIDIANYNSPLQVVISGLAKDIENAKAVCEQAGAKLYVPLQVSGAFHSRYMKESSDKFFEILKNFNFNNPQISVLSNVTARPYLKEEIIKNLKDQIDHSVRWTESIRYLLEKGVTEFEEVGPGKVLTGLIKKIQV